MSWYKEVKSFLVDIFEVKRLRDKYRESNDINRKLRQENENLKRENKLINQNNGKPLKRSKLWNSQEFVIYVDEDEDPYCPKCYKQYNKRVILNVQGSSCIGWTFSCSECDFCLNSPV